MQHKFDNDFFLNPAPSLADFLALKQSMQFSPPPDYVEFMSKHDGGEGSIGEEGYLAIWPVKDILEVQKIQELENKDFSEKYWVFGSNSGIFQYVFEKKTGKILEIDPYDDSYRVELGNTLNEFLSNLKARTF